ncbi:MAG TPA: transposase family protein [Tepidisphaeraceae bacterium]|jgi:hypothetical protein
MADALPLSLIEALSSVPDPRSRRGRRHPLPGVLALLSVGVMCGCRSVYAVLQWGRDQGKEMAAKLDLGKHGIPTDGMMSNLLRRMDNPHVDDSGALPSTPWPIPNWTDSGATHHGLSEDVHTIGNDTFYDTTFDARIVRTHDDH